MDATAEKLDAILSELHDLRRLVHRLAVPVEAVPTGEACRRLGVCRTTLMTMTAAGVFTDARPPGKRVARVPRLYLADELGVYLTEGEIGVRRLRSGLGRAF